MQRAILDFSTFFLYTLIFLLFLIHPVLYIYISVVQYMQLSAVPCDVDIHRYESLPNLFFLQLYIKMLLYKDAGVE